MPAAVIDLRTADDPRDVVHRVVQALTEGKLVALPTETVYGVAASALHEGAVERLAAVKGREVGHPFTLAIKSAESALDYAPRMPIAAQRLARRCWPGPLTLVLDVDRVDSLLQQLPDSVLRAVAPTDTIGLRVPGHDLPLAVLRLMAGPLALTSANRTGQPDAVTGQEVFAALGPDIDLIVEDGRTKFGQPSSVVRVNGNGIQPLRDGAINASALKRLGSFLILFVCTGNTCRSPMAECLMKHRLSQRLGCRPEELEDRGIIVMSAGTSGMSGGRASSESVKVMQEMKLDLSQHESQPVSDRLVRYADLILTMTRGHRDTLLSQWPDVFSRTQVVCGDEDVSDPIGGPIEGYRRCSAQIDAALEAWVEAAVHGR